MNDLGLGKLVTAAGAKRDAIHVAVVPAEAAHALNPGMRVGLDARGCASVFEDEQVGIVDPYLRVSVEKGQRFWLFLFPNTVTGMRHHWSHPHPALADPDEVVASIPPQVEDSRAISRAWIEGFAGRLDQTYNKIMMAAAGYLEDGDYTRDDTESYKNYYDQWPEFWKHYEIVTGLTATNHEVCPFTCSC